MEIDFKKTTHILLNCGWVPVDEGTFDGNQIFLDRFLLEIYTKCINNKCNECLDKCVEVINANGNPATKFKSEGKLIILPFSSILAVKLKD